MFLGNFNNPINDMLPVILANQVIQNSKNMKGDITGNRKGYLGDIILDFFMMLVASAFILFIIWVVVSGWPNSFDAWFLFPLFLSAIVVGFSIFIFLVFLCGVIIEIKIRKEKMTKNHKK